MWIPKSVVHDLVGIELEISTPDRRVLIGEDVLSGLPGVSIRDGDEVFWSESVSHFLLGEQK